MSDASTQALDVRWRITGTATWSATTRMAATKELNIPGLTPGISYDVQVRSVSGYGITSDWVTSTVVAADSSQRISQTNMSMLRVGGIGSAWTGFSISYTATTTAATDGTLSSSATISCTAGTLQAGDFSADYAASSIVVSGTPGATSTYYLYYDDDTGSGGTLPLGASSNYDDLSASGGRINVGSIDVTFPATAGSGSGSGTPGGGGTNPKLVPT